MYRIIFFAFFIVCTIISTINHAVGSEWKLFYMVSDGPKYYYDKGSVVHTSKDVIQVWFKLDDPDDTELYRAQTEINCKSKSHRILEESAPNNSSSEEKAQQTSAGQSHQRFPLESAFGSLWSNVCPGR